MSPPPRHGHTSNYKLSPTYQSWKSMKGRCRLKHRACAKYYAVLGVRICSRWDGFDAFLADMGERPPGTTLDRILSTGDYEPSNCRWATPAQQAQNRSATKLTFDQAVKIIEDRRRGVPCVDLAQEYGVSHRTISAVARGITWKDAWAKVHAHIGRDGA